jgi:predicted RNase H-like HicB family nuclease
VRESGSPQTCGKNQIWTAGLPGCWSQGVTGAEAGENIADAIREYLSVVDDQLRGEEIREIDVVV